MHGMPNGTGLESADSKTTHKTEAEQRESKSSSRGKPALGVELNLRDVHLMDWAAKGKRSTRVQIQKIVGSKARTEQEPKNSHDQENDPGLGRYARMQMLG